MDLNGGFVPILETPAGDLIIESAVVMAFAEEYAKDSGVKLIPADPVAAAKMRIEMTKFDPTMSTVWPMFGSRFADESKTQAFKETTLPKWDAMAANAGDGWLFGTPEPTMLDVHVGAFWDSLYTTMTNDGVYRSLKESLDVTNTAPHWAAYVERFRAHPSLNRYRFRKLAVEKHGVRSAGWEQGVKCQLSLAVLEGVFEAEP